MKSNALIYCTLISAVLLFSTIHSTADEPNEELNRLRALGQAFMEEEDYANAIQAFERAAAMVPESASDVYNLGMSYYHGERNDESIETLKRALTLDSNNPYTLYSLGLAHKKIGQSTEAVHYFQQVAEQDDTDIATCYNMGLGLSKLGKDDEAGIWFQKTIQLDPRHSSAYYRLFQYCIRSRQIDKAKEYQKKFLELKKTEEQRPPDAVDEGIYLGPIEFDIPVEQRPNFTSDLTIQLVPQEELLNALDQAVGKKSVPLAVFPDLDRLENTLVLSWKKAPLRFPFKRMETWENPYY